jgi:hypothetical protein
MAVKYWRSSMQPQFAPEARRLVVDVSKQRLFLTAAGGANRS